MTRAPRLLTILSRISASTREAYDADRRSNPERFIDASDGLGPNLMFVENVARKLGCNVDHVRRIPRCDLPASRVGQRLVYARADVERYVASRRDAGLPPVLSGRASIPRKALSGSNAPADFDPLSYVRKALKTPG